MKDKILNFYKQTSCYTDLGYYKEFAKKLPDNINELCMLQKTQIIHPVIFRIKNIRKQHHPFWGDMTKIPITRVAYEDDIFPTAQSVLAELLRKNPNYNKKRQAKDKVFVTCRGQALLLTSTLKAKGIPARCRVGFAEYINADGHYLDHWITEYYNKKENRWVLVDADLHYINHPIDFNLNDMPYDKFLFGAQAYLKCRKNQIEEDKIIYTSNPITLGLKGSLRCLFYDFHSLMNDEVIFMHLPKYIREKNFILSEEEYKELDALATLMLNPDNNFDKLKEIWETKTKFRIMSGALN